MRPLYCIALVGFLFFSCDRRDEWEVISPNLKKKLLGFDDPSRTVRNGVYAELGMHLQCFGDQGTWCRETLELFPLQNKWMATSPLGADLLDLHAGDSVYYNVGYELLQNPFFLPLLTHCQCTSKEELINMVVAVRSVYDSVSFDMSPYNRRILLLEQEREQIENVIALNNLTDQVTADWGGWHLILREGAGHPPVQGEEITLAYKGSTLDGLVFDDATDSTQYLYFPYGKPDQVIRGIEIAVSTMLPGEKRRIWLTSDLAFGERGSRGIVRPFSPVVFDLERIQFAENDSTTIE